jgi:hypothetical protein
VSYGPPERKEPLLGVGFYLLVRQVVVPDVPRAVKGYGVPLVPYARQ